MLIYKFELSELSYHPLGAPELNCLFGMFHSRTSEHNKDVILKSLCEIDGIMYATIALLSKNAEPDVISFGPGINVQFPEHMTYILSSWRPK